MFKHTLKLSRHPPQVLELQRRVQGTPYANSLQVCNVAGVLFILLCSYRLAAGASKTGLYCSHTA